MEIPGDTPGKILEKQRDSARNVDSKSGKSCGWNPKEIDEGNSRQTFRRNSGRNSRKISKQRSEQHAVSNLAWPFRSTRFCIFLRQCVKYGRSEQQSASTLEKRRFCSSNDYVITGWNGLTTFKVLAANESRFKCSGRRSII